MFLNLFIFLQSLDLAAVKGTVAWDFWSGFFHEKCVKEKVNNEDEIATHNKKYIEYLRLPYCSLFYGLDISADISLKGQ